MQMQELGGVHTVGVKFSILVGEKAEARAPEQNDRSMRRKCKLALGMAEGTGGVVLQHELWRTKVLRPKSIAHSATQFRCATASAQGDGLWGIALQPPLRVTDFGEMVLRYSLRSG